MLSWCPISSYQPWLVPPPTRFCSEHLVTGFYAWLPTHYCSHFWKNSSMTLHARSFIQWSTLLSTCWYAFICNLYLSMTWTCLRCWYYQMLYVAPKESHLELVCAILCYLQRYPSTSTRRKPHLECSYNLLICTIYVYTYACIKIDMILNLCACSFRQQLTKISIIIHHL